MMVNPMIEALSENEKKKHRAKSSGPKADKKTSKKPTTGGAHNPKAFAVQHTTKAARLVQRTLDYQTRKHHLPSNKHQSTVPPPIIVALVGPPKSGKSTLLKSLLKHFARQTINVVKGPITVVVGKKIRLTFIECGCDINSMLDAAKIADVVLMMVNVRCGLEMYHFEFINMTQVHGLPRIIPVLNHLDTFKESSQSRAVRRRIKQRLWVDLNSKIFLLSRFQPKKYPTSSVPDNEYSKPGDYLVAEVRRLARMIMVKIPRSTDWRTSHPYLLIDRLEDITDSAVLNQRPDVDRTVSMYGWVRGAPLPPALTAPGIHIAGLGDFSLANCTRQPDPCPIQNQFDTNTESTGNKKPSRHLTERDRKIYAPMSSLGGVLFDRDATYIDLGGSHYLTNHQQRNKSSQSARNLVVTHQALDEMHMTLNQIPDGLDEQLNKEHRIRILDDTPYLTAANGTSDEEEDGSTGNDPHLMDLDQSGTESEDNPLEDAPIFSDDLLAGFLVPAGMQPPPRQLGDGLSATEKQAPKVSKKSAHLEVKRVLDDLEWTTTAPSRVNWNRVIYGGDPVSPAKAGQIADNIPLVGGLLSTVNNNLIDKQHDHDFTIPLELTRTVGTRPDWSEPNMLERIIDRFTTGQWAATEDAQQLLQSDAQARSKLVEQEMARHAAASSGHMTYKPDKLDDEEEEMDLDDDEDDLDEDESVISQDDNNSDVEDDAAEEESGGLPYPKEEYEKKLLRPTKRQKLLEKRERHKVLFNKLYEAAGGGSEATAFYDKLVSARDAQMTANQAVLESLPAEAVEQLEGFPLGSYVRLEFNGVPHQFIDRFNPCQPLVVGGISNSEETKGYLQIRIRTHRWLKRVLRSNDPITVSIGWRRYQTIGVYSKEEHNLRNRFLKYSLPHEHCLVTIYGPLVPAKTGVVVFSNSAWRPKSDSTTATPSFRVAGTGSVTATNQSFQIMKKLKLIGEPHKIFSKTAFIRGMFNTALEVSKFVGSRIQTVSNIRGLIKAAITNPSVAKPGDFRATFEAKIGKSDLVFLRTFVAIDLPKYYNPVLNRLCAIEGDSSSNVSGDSSWRLMKTLTELRKETGTKVEFPDDSKYKPITRRVYVPTPLFVPTKLVEALPFKDKPKPSKRAARRMQGGDPVASALFGNLPPPVISHRESSDSREELLTRLRRLHADFNDRHQAKMRVRVSKHKQELAKQDKRRALLERQRRKSYFARSKGRKGKSSANE